MKIKLMKHQTELLNQINKKFRTLRTVCLAGSTGVGKTEISMQFIKNNPKKRFIILTHGMKNLRSNFSDRTNKDDSISKRVYELNKSLSKTKVLREVNSANIVIALPVGIYQHLDDLKPFDYIIIDEAHHYYISNSSEEREQKWYGPIIEWHKKKILLLTASHYKVPNDDNKKVFFAREDAFNIKKPKVIHDVPVKRVITSVSLKDSNFTGSGELKDEAKKNIPSPFKALEKYIKPKHFPMLVAVPSIQTANKFAASLKKNKFKGSFVLSNSHDDSSSDGIEAFKEGKYDICIVVNRGQLGFDYPELKTFVDATYTQNVMRIEQMIGRVTRVSKNVEDKRFVKLITDGLVREYNLILTACLALGVRSIYEAWDGNSKTLRMRVPNENKIKSVVDVGNEKPNDDSETSKKPQQSGLIETFGDYVQLLNSDKSREITLYEGIKEIKKLKEFKDSPWLFFTIAEEFVEWLKPFGYKSLIEWLSNHRASYNIAHLKKLINQIAALNTWNKFDKADQYMRFLELKDWVSENGKLPSSNYSKDANEKKISIWMRNNKKSEAFSEDINVIINKYSRSTKLFEKLKNYYLFNGCLPRQRSKNSEERKLAYSLQQIIFNNTNNDIKEWALNKGYKT